LLRINKKVITLVCFAIFALIVFLPPIIHGYVYPTTGDDSGMHLEIIKNQNLFDQLYYGYVLIGYPLNWLSSVGGVSVNLLFMWFNYLVLFLIGVSFYFVISRLVNFQAGLFSLAIPFFVSLGIWWEFDYGMVFNLINMGIVLPFLLYFSVKLFYDFKFRYLVGVFSCGVLFSLLHSTGIYLAPLLISLLLIYTVTKKIRNQKSDKKIFSAFGVLALVSISCVFWLFLKTNDILPQAVGQSFQGELFPIQFYIQGLSTISSVMLGYSLYLMIDYKNVKREVILVLVILVVLMVILLISTIGISPSPDRQIFDMAIIFGVATSICVGVVVSYKRSILFVMSCLVIFGVLLNLSNWFDYHSAVKPIDVKAINYVNTLDADTFTVSPTVAVLIYKQFVNGKYIEGYADIFITRSKPMTPISDKTSVAYVPHGRESTEGYTLDRVFEDGDIKIEVFRK